MDEDGLREMRDNMAAAAKIVKQHHAGTPDTVIPQVGASRMHGTAGVCMCGRE